MSTELQLIDGAITTRKRNAGVSKEDEFAFQCRAHRLPEPARQALFAKSIGRRWMFDFCWQPYMLAVEIEGLVVRKLAGQLVVMGRHASIQGFKDDAEKYAWANVLGWHVMRFEQSQVKSGFAVEMTMRFLITKGWAR